MYSNCRCSDGDAPPSCEISIDRDVRYTARCYHDHVLERPICRVLPEYEHHLSYRRVEASINSCHIIIIAIIVTITSITPIVNIHITTSTAKTIVNSHIGSPLWSGSKNTNIPQRHLPYFLGLCQYNPVAKKTRRTEMSILYTETLTNAQARLGRSWETVRTGKGWKDFPFHKPHENLT